MKVKELVKYLEGLDQEMKIILSSDAEGSFYSPLSGYNIGIYVKDSEYQGDMYYDEWEAKDSCMNVEEWDEILKKDRAVVLWPTR